MSATKRARRERETPEFVAMCRRMIRAAGRRVADADPEDLVELVQLQGILDAAIADAVKGQRERYDRSWSEIARALGVSRQAAQQRWTPKPARAATDPRPGALFLIEGGA